MRWSQSSHTLSGATQSGMWVAMKSDSGPITHNTMLFTLRGSMSSHGPIHSLQLCKCPVNFLCNYAKATESDHGNLSKHVLIMCDIPAYHKQGFTFFGSYTSDDKICHRLLFIKHFCIDGTLKKLLVFVQVKPIKQWNCNKFDSFYTNYDYGAD